MINYFLAFACVCGLLLSMGHAQDPAAVPDPPLRSMFHCARLGISCDSEATCLPDIGLCDCPDGFEGYDCSVNSTLIEIDDCECKNGGTCVEDAGDYFCYCPDAYYGEMCEEIRVSQTCHPDSIEMTVVPYADQDPFRGTIYVHNNPTDGCFLTDGSGTGLYTNTIAFDACEGASTDTNADGDTEVSFSVLVQYMPNILTQYDQQFVFKCILRKSDSLLEVPGNMVTNDEEQSPLDKQEVTGELVPVHLTLVSADTGEEVTTPQGIGTDLKLRFTLNGGDVYDSFRVEKVVAHNGLDDPVEALNLVSDGCVTPEGGSVVTGFSGDPFTQVELPFTLFKFLHSGQVAFRVTVMLCQGTGGCNTTVRLGLVLNDQGFPRVEAFTMPRRDCDMYAGVGRKRRDVGEDDIILEEEEGDNTLERLDSPGVFVWIPGDEEGQQSGRLRPIDYPQKLTESAFSIHKPGLCFQNIWFIICVVAIVMAFTLLGALVAVLCLHSRYSRDKIDSSPHHTYVTTPAGLDNKGFGSTKF